MIFKKLSFRFGFLYGIAAISLFLPGASQAKERIVIAHWGGVYGDSLKKNVLDPFAAKYDVEFVIFRQSSTEGMTKVIAEKPNPTIDIVFGTPASALNGAKAGVVVPLTVKDVPQLANFPESLRGVDQGEIKWIIEGVEKTGLTIRRDLVKIPEKITTDWLKDPALKGKIAVPLPTWNDGVMLNQLSFAAGSSPSLDKGFDIIKQIAPNVRLVWTTSGEAIRLMTSGEIAVSYAGVAGATKLRASGLDVEFRSFSDLPTYVVSETVAVIKDGPGNKDLVMKFLDYYLSPDVLAAYDAGTAMSSSNLKSPPLPKDAFPYATTPEELKTAKVADVSIDKDQVLERWKREIVPLIGQ